MNKFKIALLAGLLFAGQAGASQENAGRQQSADFRYKDGVYILYAHYYNNENALDVIDDALRKHKQELRDGKLLFRVKGYSNFYADSLKNLRAAKVYSNVVKSFFITNSILKEEYCYTTNFSEPYDGHNALVRVSFVDAENPDGDVEEYDVIVGRSREEAERLAAEEAARRAAEEEAARRAAEEEAARRAAEEEAARLAAEAEAARLKAQADSLAQVAAQPKRQWINYWSIKTNLLYDAVLFPTLEFEYQKEKEWSINVEGSIAWYKNDSKHRYYQLAQVSPEARWWFKSKTKGTGHYAGVFGGVGLYDLENKNTGYKGEFWMTGLSYGYVFPIGKYFYFDAGIGFGYLATRYDEYLPIDGHYVFQKKNNTKYFGPLKLKLSLVWKFDGLKKKGGKK